MWGHVKLDIMQYPLNVTVVNGMRIMIGNKYNK